MIKQRFEFHKSRESNKHKSIILIVGGPIRTMLMTCQVSVIDKKSQVYTEAQIKCQAITLSPLERC